MDIEIFDIFDDTETHYVCFLTGRAAGRRLRFFGGGLPWSLEETVSPVGVLDRGCLRLSVFFFFALSASACGVVIGPEAMLIKCGPR